MNDQLKMVVVVCVAAIISTTIICVTVFGMRAMAFKNGYEQSILPGSTMPRWVKAK